MKPRFRIYLRYINDMGEGRYNVQRRFLWFFWETISHTCMPKDAAQAVLEKLLRGDI